MTTNSEDDESGGLPQDSVSLESPSMQSMQETPALPHAQTTSLQVVSGRILRFAGMFTIVAMAVLGVTMTSESKILGLLGKESVSYLFGVQPIGPLILTGLVGAAMHFVGRKLAPDTLGASKRGGFIALILFAGPLVFIWVTTVVVVAVFGFLLDMFLAIIGL